MVAPQSAIVGLVSCLAIVSCSLAQSTRVNFPLVVKQEMELATPSAAVAVAWSPDGSRIAAAIGFGTRIVVWDRSGRQLSQFDVGSGRPNLLGSIAFVDGSSHLLFPPPIGAGDGVILSVRDALSGQVVENVQGLATGGSPTVFTVSPDQRFLAIEAADSSPQGFKVAIAGTHDWKFVRGYPREKGAMSLNFFAKSQKLVAGTVQGIVTVLDAVATNPPREFHPLGAPTLDVPTAMAVAGSPDGALIFAGLAGEDVVAAKVVRVSDGASIASFPLASHQSICAADWDPKGRYVAFLDNERALTLWRPLAPNLSYEKISVPGAVKELAVTSDGDSVAVATETGVVVYSVG